MADTRKRQDDVLVLVGGQQAGLTVIPRPTPLTRLNYFDGKFLRADDLQQEQRYLRQLVELSNRGGGAGVVYGFDTTLTGDTLRLGAGLAIDPQGRVLLLPGLASIDVARLIEASRRVVPGKAAERGAGTFGDCELATETPPDVVVEPSDLYLLTIAHAEALCGQEDVYGKLCEEACITTSDRPYRIEGFVVRVRPLPLTAPLPDSRVFVLSDVHLRSRIASAYFEHERRTAHPSLVSKPGLRSPVWCLGAKGLPGDDVPLAVIARRGGMTLFLDAWTARRERMEAPARTYWAWRMAMRPWYVFLAQVLQFQCHLAEALTSTPGAPGPNDPCRQEHELLHEAHEMLGKLDVQRFADVGEIVRRMPELTLRLRTWKLGLGTGPGDHILIHRGIIELPAAGYLPVDAQSTEPIDSQVRRLLGDGVNLRFCAVRPDYVPHALEEAQHMERISLVDGLENAEAKPDVDILVPDGSLQRRTVATIGTGWQATFALERNALAMNRLDLPLSQRFHGAARSEMLQTGEASFYFAGATEVPDDDPAIRLEDVRTTRAFFDTFEGAAPADDAARREDDASVDRLVRRFQPVAFAARDAMARLRVLSAAGDPVPAFTPDEAEAGGTRLGAAWMGMTVQRNPFEARPNDSMNVDVEWVIGFPGRTVNVTTHGLKGAFVVKEVGTAQGRTTVKGTFTGTPVGTAFGQGRLELAVQVERDRTPDGADVVTFTAEPPSETARRVGLTGTATWSGSPVEVTATFNELGAKSGPGMLLREDAAVLQPAHPLRTLSENGLVTLSALLKDEQFDEPRARRLFPPAGAASDQTTVRGRHDWVLFHRRRS